MADADRFGDVLARLRQRRGFSSAHAFYTAIRGRRVLGLAYVSYLHLEKGRTLPQPARLRRLIAALDLSESSAQAGELIRAYLTTLLGSDELLRSAAMSASNGGDSFAWRLAEEGARQAMSQKTVRLNPDQYRLLTDVPAAWLCHLSLSNTAGWVSREEIFRMTGLRAAVLRNSLNALARVGLAELSNGKARSPLARKYVAPPAHLPLSGRMSEGWNRNAVLKKGRAPISLACVAVRMSKAQRDRYFQHLQDTVRLSHVYGDPKKTDGSDVYLVEGCVYRILD